MAANSSKEAHLHHALTDPPLAAAALYGASTTATEFIHHPGAVVTAAVVCAVVGGAAGVMSHRHMWRLIHLALCAAYAVTWLAYTQFTSPFTASAVTSLIIGLAALWPLYPVAWNAERNERAAAVRTAESLVERKVRAGDWPGMLAALGQPRIQVEDTIEQPAGYTKVLRLPADGSITFERVRGVIKQLEVALSVQPGWVRTERGVHAGQVLVHVTTRDVLADTVPLPPSTGPRSVNDPFDIGVDERAELMEVLIREVAALMVGLRGSGKSNLLNVLIERLTSCVDVVIWMIDLKGGRTARPWLQPWLDGKTQRPVIDWVATDRDEAALMLQAALAAIDVRATSGAGGEKVTPSAEQPAILLICEEISALVGLHAPSSRGSTNLLTSIAQLGRSEAIDPILITQRGTVTMTGSGDLKSQCKLRIGLGVASAADARLLFDDAQMSSGVAALVHPGSMYVQDDDARPVPAKGYRVEFGDIYGLAEACSWLRPGLEPDLEDALGDVYAQRWSMERAGHLTGAHKPKPLQAAAPSIGRPTTVPAASTATLPTIPPPPADAQPAWRTAKGDPIPRAFDPNEFNAAFDEIAERLKGIDTPADTAPHPGRLRMLGLLLEAGRDGLSPAEIVNQLGKTGQAPVRQTVQAWLSLEVKAGSIVRRNTGDYVHKDHT